MQGVGKHGLIVCRAGLQILRHVMSSCHNTDHPSFWEASTEMRRSQRKLTWVMLARLITLDTKMVAGIFPETL